jgi:tetratricopeptide (TPR) repeat protein
VRGRFSLVLILALALSGAGIWRTGVYLNHARYSGDITEEMMYFPSGKLTEIASVGFDSLASVMLWLRGIQYYGAHKKTDQYYFLAEHIFQTITDLDPNFISAYRFGAFVISQDMAQPAGGVELLRKGISHNHDSWELFFDLGFLYFVDIGDGAKAARYFNLASRFPDAPEVAKRFSAFAYKQSGNYALSRRLWEEIYESTTNQAMRDNAEYALRMLDMDESIRRLNAAVGEYEARYGAVPARLADLVGAGLVRALPEDPFGGRYFLDARAGQVLSTTRVEDEAGKVTNMLQRKVEYYRQRRGAYPETLEALAEEDLITGVPVVDGAVIVYERDGGVVRYTVSEESHM